MPHAGGRDVHSELLDGSWNFKDFLAPLNIQIKGVASTSKEDAAHVWRLVDRSLLTQAGFQESAIEVHHPDWQNLPPVGSDVILLTKTYMHSPNYSQNPLLLLPATEILKLSKDFFGEGVCFQSGYPGRNLHPL